MEQGGVWTRILTRTPIDSQQRITPDMWNSSYSTGWDSRREEWSRLVVMHTSLPSPLLVTRSICIDERHHSALTLPRCKDRRANNGIYMNKANTHLGTLVNMSFLYLHILLNKVIHINLYILHRGEALFFAPESDKSLPSLFIHKQ